MESGLIQMDSWKGQAVTDWLILSCVREVQLQRFLGFAHFHSNFSSVDALLSALSKGGRVKFFWTHEAEAAFSELKCRFISVPILTFPESDKPLLVVFHRNVKYIQQAK